MHLNCRLTHPLAFEALEDRTLLSTLTLAPSTTGRIDLFLPDVHIDDTFLGPRNDDPAHRVLVDFDESSISPHVPITDATVLLGAPAVDEDDLQSVLTVSVHQNLDPVDISTVTWNNQPAHGPALDTHARTMQQWRDAGAAFEITHLVQGWVDGTIPNYGLKFIADEATVPGVIENKALQVTTYQLVVTIADVQTVTIDIKPGGDPNAINLRANGVLPVAVLTTDDFDATTVDISDLSRIAFGDVDVSGRVSPMRSGLEDVDADGDTDVILHFSLRAIRDAGALVSTTTEAELTGFTTDGTSFRGTDAVVIVTRGRGTAIAFVTMAETTGVQRPAQSRAHKSDLSTGRLAIPSDGVFPALLQQTDSPIDKEDSFVESLRRASGELLAGLVGDERWTNWRSLSNVNSPRFPRNRAV